MSRRLVRWALRAVKGPLLGYKDVYGGFEELGNLGRERQRSRGFFSGMVRGVSDPREGSKILTFLFRPQLVCISYISEVRSSTEPGMMASDA